MPLINCPECESKVSDGAPSCPSCGVLIPKVKVCLVWTGKNVLLFILLCVPIFFVSGSFADKLSRAFILEPAWDAGDAARDLDEARRKAEAAKTYFGFVQPPPPYGTFRKAHAPIFGYEFWQHWFPIAFGIITGIFGGYKITTKIAGRKIAS